MFRDALRALAASVIVALFGALTLWAGARWLMPAAVHGPVAEGAWTARSRAMFEPSGFYRAEIDPDTLRHFIWTSGHAQLTFRNLDRSIAHLVTLEFRTGRPAGDPLPAVRVSVDDQLVLNAETTSAGKTLSFEIPRRDQAGATVVFDVTPVYTPGGADTRTLGILIDDVAVSPVHGSFRPTGRVLAQAAAAVGACALVLWWLGLRGWLFGVAAAAVTAGFTWLLLIDAAFAGAFPDRLAGIGLAVLLAGAGLGLLRWRWWSIAGAPGWSCAAAIVLAVTAVKLGVFWHPLAIVGDGIYQVHRAQAVHAGNYFFTSVTPRPFYEFPYPVALYVAAQPFWSWFPGELDLLRLLRTLAIVTDAIVGVALYVVAKRQWPTSRVPIFAAALYPFARAPFEALSNANLTNLFGQSVFGLALAAIAWFAAGTAVSWVAIGLALVLLVIAFLSHFGTLTVGLCVLGAIAVGLVVVGRGSIRRAGVWVIGLMLAASAVSWVVYYSRPEFRAVYAKTYASMSSREADNSSKIDAAPSVKLQRWWSGVGDDYGRPGVLILAATLAGLFLALRRQPREGSTLVFAFWIAAWLALSALGILTSLTLRANLAVAPAMAVFAAFALAAVADRSRAGVVLAAGVFAFIAWNGWQVAVACLELTGAR